MVERLKRNLHSLSAQMILSFVALVLLTAIAIGLPAMWLIRDQLARQAWAQVEQGRRATQALYQAQRSEMSSLATLTAQRPTLRDLLAEGQPGQLQAYLLTLQTGAGLDLVLVCDQARQLVAQTGQAALESLCATSTETGFHVVGSDDSPQIWLFAAHQLDDQAAAGFRVLVGLKLDDLFAGQMRDQTGLEHTLMLDGRRVATSFADDAEPKPSQRSDQPAGPDGERRVTLEVNGLHYYAIRFPLAESGVQAEVALGGGDIVTTQRRLAWTLVGAILSVIVVGSGVGALLARRIGRPLAHLADAAATLSRGDLSTPVAVAPTAGVREVALVAQALERARADLRHTLDQLRQEKAWGEHLLEAIVEGIVTLDAQGRITFFSQGAERITGWDRDQVTGKTCDQVFLTLEASERFSQLIPQPGRHQKIAVELRDGRQALLSVTGARLLPAGDDQSRVALVFRDVSEEGAIHRLLGDFLANVAHEFRTPLAAVAASVELLLDQAPDLSADELGELLMSLHLGVLGLQTLVDNLLESASIETGHFRVSPHPANLGEIIAEAVRTMQPLLDKRGQRLMVELPAATLVVQADPRRVVQVFVNLLSNASKYGPDEAEIAIQVATSQGWVRVAVADQGPGIPLEHRQDLFRRFKRPGSANDYAQYGAGLGLSVVKAVVEAHGGEVGVDDRPGGGAIFWFTLKASRG